MIVTNGVISLFHRNQQVINETHLVYIFKQKFAAETSSTFDLIDYLCDAGIHVNLFQLIDYIKANELTKKVWRILVCSSIKINSSFSSVTWIHVKISRQQGTNKRW